MKTRIRSHGRMFKVQIVFKSVFFFPFQFQTALSPFTWRVTERFVELLAEIAFVGNPHLVSHYNNLAVRVLADDSPGFLEAEFLSDYSEALPHHIRKIVGKCLDGHPEFIGDISHGAISPAIAFLRHP